VSVNLGIRDIKNPEITDMIFNFLECSPHPESFVFEILENEDIDDYEELVEFVDRIHELGGLISIDDFGSGYSNLQHIASINFDYLKLDGSIVKKCTQDEQCVNLIALIAGWKNLSNNGMKIIAEYVENQDIQNTLMQYGIDYSQGYLFSRPDPDIDAHKK
jgi:EAL domain-containing protein (putative c-di-GMP-specific phosphodiesterase class I)